MSDTNEVCITTVRLELDAPAPARPQTAHLLRGALGHCFPGEPLLHQHGPQQELHYRYPLIHFRWWRSEGWLVGFQEGAERLLELPLLGKSLLLGEQEVTIVGAQVRCSLDLVRQSKRLRRYSFRSPWLPLNQERYEDYHRLSLPQQVAERDRLAVAHLLTTLRGLGVEISWQLYAAIEERRHLICKYKNTAFHGILGDLIVNADLPTHLAMGRAVSHGFGWLLSAAPDKTNHGHPS